MDAPTRTLITRAKAQDREAVEQLFTRYRDRLRAALRRLLGERYRRYADSEDAAHDAILSALGRLDRFEERGEGSFLAWLLRCAELDVLERLRSLSARKRDSDRAMSLDASGVPEPIAVQATPSQIAAGHELEERVRRCLDRMPAAERDVIVLRRYLALETEEIRAELELPTAGAARALLSRAQARLAALLSIRDGG